MPHMGVLSRVVVLALLSAAPAAARPGDESCQTEAAKLKASDAGLLDHLGQSVSVEGGAALVGAAEDDDNGTNSGSAYVFVRSGGDWVQHAKLLPSDGGPFHTFGASVSLSGGTALVGAPFDSEIPANCGTAFVFVRSGASWTQQAKLVASDPADLDVFGTAVAVSGELALVGAPRDDDNGSESGSAYVFVRDGSTWTQEAKLLASDGSVGDFFGSAVALDGDLALVGAYLDDDGGSSSGAVYVFVRDGGTWTQEAKLTASDGAANDAFGISVALSGQTAIVGAYRDSDQGSSSGSAYVFVRSGTSWTEQAKLLAYDGSSFDEFGGSVSIGGDRAAVGSRFRNGPGGGSSAGAVYPFSRSGGAWASGLALVPSDVTGGLQLGFAVGASGDTVIGTTILDGAVAPESGAAYVFELAPAPGAIDCTCPAGPCGNDDDTAGCANSTGGGARLAGFGSTQPDELELFATGAPAGRFAILIQSNAAALMPFGDGFRCLGAPVLRLMPTPRPVTQHGTLGYGPCFGDPPVSSLTGVVPGSGTIERYQLWYRDPGGPCSSNFNLSNGFEVVW